MFNFMQLALKRENLFILNYDMGAKCSNHDFNT